jgi:hypothetical protein
MSRFLVFVCLFITTLQYSSTLTVFLAHDRYLKLCQALQKVVPPITSSVALDFSGYELILK